MDDRNHIKYDVFYKREKLMNFLNNGLLISPHRLCPITPAWTGHIPFAGWIMEEHRPNIFVELGTHAGLSYSSFCQAAIENRLLTKCYAVDTWKGDEHSWTYDESIFKEYSEYHQERYASFSQLLRMTFDEALNYFSDGSVDLLHIDGLHTYEAVKHDFETWLPKMSDRGIILFHDTNVRERNFGVWKLWEEVSQHYPGFEFQHSHGLGVLLIGSNIPEKIKFLQKEGDWFINKMIPRVAESLSLKNTVTLLQQNVSEYNQKITLLNQTITEQNELIANSNQIIDTIENIEEHTNNLNQQIIYLNQKIADLNEALIESNNHRSELSQAAEESSSHINNLIQSLAGKDLQIENLTQTLNSLSNSIIWRLSKPLRLIGNQLSKIIQIPIWNKNIKMKQGE